MKKLKYLILTAALVLSAGQLQVSAAEKEPVTIKALEDGKASVELQLSDGADEDITSFQIGFQIQPVSGTLEKAELAFSEGLQDTLVHEAVYNQKTGILNVYVSDRNEVFQNGKASLGTITLTGNKETGIAAEISVVEDSFVWVNHSGSSHTVDGADSMPPVSVSKPGTGKPDEGGSGDNNQGGNNGSGDNNQGGNNDSGDNNQGGNNSSGDNNQGGSNGSGNTGSSTGSTSTEQTGKTVTTAKSGKKPSQTASTEDTEDTKDAVTEEEDKEPETPADEESVSDPAEDAAAVPEAKKASVDSGIWILVVVLAVLAAGVGTYVVLQKKKRK